MFPLSSSLHKCSWRQLIGTCFLVSAVKPTFIDVDIYVNSIGPVSVIQMVSARVAAGSPCPLPVAGAGPAAGRLSRWLDVV